MDNSKFILIQNLLYLLLTARKHKRIIHAFFPMQILISLHLPLFLSSHSTRFPALGVMKFTILIDPSLVIIQEYINANLRSPPLSCIFLKMHILALKRTCTSLHVTLFLIKVFMHNTPKETKIQVEKLTVVQTLYIN